MGWEALFCQYSVYSIGIPGLVSCLLSVLLPFALSFLSPVCVLVGRCCIMALSLALAFMTIILIMKILGYISF